VRLAWRQAQLVWLLLGWVAPLVWQGWGLWTEEIERGDPGKNAAREGDSAIPQSAPKSLKGKARSQDL